MAITVNPVRNVERRTDPAPNQYQDASAATPDAFGAAQGRALGQLAQGIGSLGNSLSDIGERQKEEDRARQVLQAKTTFDDAQRVMKFGEDGNGGLFNKQGVDAIGVTKQVADWYKQQSAATLGTVTDPKTRIVLERTLAAQRDADLNATAARESENRLKANASVQSQAVQSATQAIANDPLNEDGAKVQITAGVAAIRSNIAGKPKELLDAEEKAFISDAQTQRIARVAVSDPAKAETMYGALKEQISGSDHAKIEKLLEPLRETREGTQIGKSIVSAPGPAVQQAAALAGPISGGRFGTAGIIPPAIAAGVRGQESNGNPNAESPKGAAGPMQVMPETAREISIKRGDGLIGPNTSHAEIKAILKDPAVGQVYGESYMRDMLLRFGGDLPSALVAYNAGPAVAESWLKKRSGPGDLSSLPAETQKYVPETMARIARAQAGDATKVYATPDQNSQLAMGKLPPPGEKMTAENWSLKFYKPEDILAPTGGGRQVDARSAIMADTLGQRFFEATGKRVGINDVNPSPGTAGKRRGVADPSDNPHVSKSQHLDGRAFDFQVQGLSADEKRQFLTMARQVGFSGVGFYEGGSGHLHLDTGRPRSWGTQPTWAGRAMGIPALGQSDVAVPATLGGLPVPASMRAGAGGGATGAVRAGSEGAGNTPSFLPPALTGGNTFDVQPAIASLSSQVAAAPVAAAGSGGVTSAPSLVPPTASSSIRLDMDFDANALRQQVADQTAESRPAVRAAAAREVERYIRTQEANRKGMLRQLKYAGIRHIQGGGSADDLPPDVLSSLSELDPKFIEQLGGMEDRIAKRKDKTDEGVYYKLSRMTPEEFNDVDLTEYLPKLSQADGAKLMDRQRSEGKASAADQMKFAGIQNQNQIATAALKAAGIFPDKDDAAANQRAGMFWRQLEQTNAAFEAQNKRAMTPKEYQDEANRLLQVVNQADWGGGKQFLFEQGTAEENRARARDKQPPVGYGYQNFSVVTDVNNIPFEQFTTLKENYTRMSGQYPKPAQAVQFFNDYTALQTGRDPAPSTEDRTQIIAALRRQYGPGIQNDSARADELEMRIKKAYNAKLNKLFAPPPQPSP